jgi:hypothetical protein
LAISGDEDISALRVKNESLIFKALIELCFDKIFVPSSILPLHINVWNARYPFSREAFRRVSG